MKKLEYNMSKCLPVVKKCESKHQCLRYKDAKQIGGQQQTHDYSDGIVKDENKCRVFEPIE